jgi:ribosomal protein S18 acetylase RimI-like enzyme
MSITSKILDSHWTYRKAEPQDAQQLAEVHEVVSKFSYTNEKVAEYLNQLPIAKRVRAWQETFKSDTDTVWLAEDIDLVGFIHLEEPKQTTSAEIKALYVLPTHWRKGIGADLVKQAITQCKQDGYKSVTAWVLDDSHPAQHFYQKCGFRKGNLSKYDTSIPECELKLEKFSLPLPK